MRKGLIFLSIIILLVAVTGTVGAKVDKTGVIKDNASHMKEVVSAHNPNVTEASFTVKRIETGSGMVVLVDPLEVFAD